jgi:hypothetical protein
MPKLTMATDLSDLRPAVAFELSNELSHLHECNLKTGCDTRLKSAGSDDGDLGELPTPMRAANDRRLEAREVVVQRQFTEQALAAM